MSTDLSSCKKDFPIFERKVRGGNSLIYLDSGATSQKPNSVIEAESNFYRTVNAAVHRELIYWPKKPPKLMSQLEKKLQLLLVL